MKKKKVFFIASYPESLINFRLQLMLAVRDCGYDVVALAPKDERTQKLLLSHQIRYQSISLSRTGTNPFCDLYLFFSLWRLFRKENPSIIFSYTMKPVVYGSLAASLARVPHIYSLITGTGYVFYGKGLINRSVGFLAQYLLKKALAKNTKVFFQNEDNKNLFLQKKLLDQNQPVALVNGSGVDCDFFTPQPYPQEVTFLMIARLLVDKGVYEYVNAVKKIKQKYPHVKAYLVGWIDSNPHAIKKEELASWVKAGDITYLGKLDDVRNAIAMSSVYVLPSYHEGIPRTVLEAMAMARPIITTDVPGCRQTTLHEKNGLLIQVKNVDALYQAMTYFIGSPEKIEVMGKVSRELARRRYDVHRVNKVMLNEMNMKAGIICGEK